MSQPQLNVIRTTDGIEELETYLSQFDIIAFDTETTGVQRTDQIVGVSFCASEDRADYIVLSEWRGGELSDLGNYARVLAMLERLDGKSLVAHNATFDCAMVEHFFRVRLIDSIHTDTMILAHLLDENRKVGLKELAKQYFGVAATKEADEMRASVEANGGLITKASYEMYKADSQLLGKYGAQDAMLTYKLFFILVEELYAQGLDKFFYEEESMPLLRGPTYELNTTGLKMDREALTTLKKTLEAECAEAKTFILNEIRPYVQDKYPGTNKKNTFNLGSTSQLAWLLFDKLELEFGTLTDGGKEACRQMGLKLPYTAAAKREFIRNCLYSAGHTYQEQTTIAEYSDGELKHKTIRAKKIKEPWGYIQVDKKTLAKFAPKYKWIQKLLEYQKNMKIISTYIEGFEERMLYGVVNPSFLQHGSTSGRYASRNPNLQNLPRDEKRIKQCVISRPGKVFVGADFSQLEPRVFAYLSQDEALISAFNGSDDFYSVIGQRVYGKTDCVPRKDGSPDAFGIKYKKLRDLSKVIALATVYGATAYQLASTTGKGTEDTQADMDAYLDSFPDVRRLMIESHDMARTNGEVKNLYGRPRRIPEAKRISKNIAHADLPRDQRGILNLSTNHRVQSTAASIVNRAMIAFYNMKTEANIDCKIVSMVHDSIIIECAEEDADSVSALLQTAMEDTTTLPGVPLEAKPSIGRNLAEV